MNRRLNYLIFALILMSLIGCANVNSSNTGVFMAKVATRNPALDMENEYILRRGDVVDVKFFYNQELNETVTIRPDGKITLQLIDEVAAAGLKPSELDKILTEKYSKALPQTEISVIVKEFAGYKVYVGGEVKSAGIIKNPGSLTALQAILQAGGFKDTSELRSVVILRNQGTNKPLFMTINLKEDLTTNNKHNDILLKPYDIVFVPKTTIAKMNQFVDQYFNKLIPISKSLGVVYNLNPEVEVK